MTNERYLRRTICPMLQTEVERLIGIASSASCGPSLSERTTLRALLASGCKVRHTSSTFTSRHAMLAASRIRAYLSLAKRASGATHGAADERRARRQCVALLELLGAAFGRQTASSGSRLRGFHPAMCCRCAVSGTVLGAAVNSGLSLAVGALEAAKVALMAHERVHISQAWRIFSERATRGSAG